MEPSRWEMEVAQWGRQSRDEIGDSQVHVGAVAVISIGSPNIADGREMNGLLCVKSVLTQFQICGPKKMTERTSISNWDME